MDLGATSDLLMVNGLLDLEGATLNVQATSGTLAVGDYELISFTSITGSNLLVGALPAGLAGTIVNTGTAIYLDLVAPPQTLTWTGSQTTGLEHLGRELDRQRRHGHL